MAKKLSRMNSKYAGGGKPIGSTGLFEKGGKTYQYAGHKVVIGIYRKRYVVVSADEGDHKGLLWANEYFKEKDDAIQFAKDNKFDILSDKVFEPNKQKSKENGYAVFDLPKEFSDGGWTGKPVNSGDITQPVYAKGGITFQEIDAIVADLNSRYDGKNEDELLKEANKKLHGYGVEGINEKGLMASYVNMGDTYDYTVLYDQNEDKFVATSWGDWYEENGGLNEGSVFIFNSYEERGVWTIDVTDAKTDKSVWDYRFEGGEDETSLVDDGFMRNMQDISGLEEYLKGHKVIDNEARLITQRDYDRGFYLRGGKPIGSTGLFAKGGAVDYNNPESYDDYHLAHDVELFAENDGNLYRQRYIPIIKNLKKKKDKGTFNEELAATLWKYYWEDADKRYQKQIMERQPKGYVLSVKDRQLLSAKMANWVGSVAHDNDLTFAKGGELDDETNVDHLFREVTDYGETAIDEFVENSNGFGYENNYERRTGEVDHKPSSGFIPFTNGGVDSTWFEYASSLVGSGKRLPTSTLQSELERVENFCYTNAREEFIKKYPAIVEKIGEDKINYNDLYDEGFGSEAEELSESEHDCMMDETIMFRLGFYLYKPTNSRSVDRKPTCYVFGIVNMEAPYHREGNMEDFVEDEFNFHNLEGFKKKLAKSLEKIKSWYEGGSYDQGRELVVRRMAMGGMPSDDIGGKMIRIVNPMTTDNTLGAHAGSPITSQDGV